MAVTCITGAGRGDVQWPVGPQSGPAITGGSRGIDKTFQHDFGFGGHVEIDAAAGDHVERFCPQQAGHGADVAAGRQRRRGGQQKRRIAADDHGQRHLLVPRAIVAQQPGVVVVCGPADGQPRRVELLQIETSGHGPMRIGLGRKDRAPSKSPAEEPGCACPAIAANQQRQFVEMDVAAQPDDLLAGRRLDLARHDAASRRLRAALEPLEPAVRRGGIEQPGDRSAASSSVATPSARQMRPSVASRLASTGRSWPLTAPNRSAGPPDCADRAAIGEPHRRPDRLLLPPGSIPRHGPVLPENRPGSGMA